EDLVEHLPVGALHDLNLHRDPVRAPAQPSLEALASGAAQCGEIISFSAGKRHYASWKADRPEQPALRRERHEVGGDRPREVLPYNHGGPELPSFCLERALGGEEGPSAIDSRQQTDPPFLCAWRADEEGERPPKGGMNFLKPYRQWQESVRGHHLERKPHHEYRRDTDSPCAIVDERVKECELVFEAAPFEGAIPPASFDCRRKACVPKCTGDLGLGRAERNAQARRAWDRDDGMCRPEADGGVQEFHDKAATTRRVQCA